MILSNTEIIKGVQNKSFSIDPLAGNDPGKAPFNTSAVDLRLGDTIRTLNKDIPAQLDLTKGSIAQFLANNSKLHNLTKEQPFSLEPNKLVLANTYEKVNFPLRNGETCYGARVEGKSSLARCGILIHFTAPTIHANFKGKITLEIINLGTITFLLVPKMYICQLIIEKICGEPVTAPNQFTGQTDPTGLK
ncbi:MAG: dCTP deaminase [Deltaproteobacteria bacterium]|nr:dCTP deaminase [Deltaproteobacteria bacterium]